MPAYRSKYSANKMRCFLCFFLSLAINFFSPVSAQDPVELKYITQIVAAPSDSLRILAYSQLADYYFAQAEDDKGDSVLQKQLMHAEESRSQNLMLLSLFRNARFQHTASFSRYHIDRSIKVIERALQYAKINGLEDYTALAYSKLAAVYNTIGKSELAFRNASIGFTTALHSPNDSIKTLCAIELGSVYMQQGEILMAFKTYTNAYDYANNMHNPTLLSKVYHQMSGLFRKLGDNEAAKDYILKSLDLNKRNSNVQGMIEDYLVFGKLHDYRTGIAYLQRAERLADSVGNIRSKVNAQKLIFIQKMIHAEPSETLSYLNTHPQVAKSFVNLGPGQFEWKIAQVFLYQNQPDSALAYLKKAEPLMTSEGYDFQTKAAFFYEYAMANDKLKNLHAAVDQYRFAMEFARNSSDLYMLRELAAALKTSYNNLGEYKLALEYDQMYDRFTDSVNLLGKEKDVALLQIDNENKRRLKEAEIAAAKERRKHDLQYMGITIAIGVAFVLLLTMGMFTVSKLTIRIMTFFSFILLFEFIILVLDAYIHHMTHGEPLKIYAIKIVIISMLFPIHHLLEEKLLHYLMSKKLITLRSRFSLKKLIFGEKKPAVHSEQQAADLAPVSEPVVSSNQG
jgi:tetratricopeptide (TPR) repeat protein